jgi:hypothetical protein
MLAPAVLSIVATASVTFLAQGRGGPETYTATLQVRRATAGKAAATTQIQIEIQRYTPEADRKSVEEALKFGGYPSFLTALRKAPDVGTVTHGNKKWTIRWARERSSAGGRSIVLVTDQPIFFVGGGAIDAKPRAGYEVAVIQMDVDGAGVGKGSMAAAARVKPGGESGVVIEDYASDPIELVSVVRKTP